MFWRRKKVDKADDQPQRLVQHYTPDQVADALLGETDFYDSEPHSEQENTATAQHTTAAPQPYQAQPDHTHHDDEFYLEAEFESDEPDTTSNAPTTTPEPVQTVAALMDALKAQPLVSPPNGPSDAELLRSGEEVAVNIADLPPLNLPELQAEDLSAERPTDEAAPQEEQEPVLADSEALLVTASPDIGLGALASSESTPAAPEPAPLPPMPVSNMDWPLETLRGVELDAAHIAETLAPDWAASGLLLQESAALRLIRRVILRVPLVLRNGQQELWVFPYPDSSEQSAAHFLAVEHKANLYGAVAVYIAPAPLELSGLEPTPLESDIVLSFERWPEDKPFPEGDYALWWPSQAGEQLTSSEEGRLMTRVFTLQDEAASLLYGLMSQQLNWNMHNYETLRRELPEKTEYLNVMDNKGRAMILSAAQDKGVRLHLLRSPESEQVRRYWLEQTEHLLKIMVNLLLESQQPLDTLWHDYETRPSQWWKAAQQVLDLRLDIGDDLHSIQIGNVTEEQAAQEE